MANKLCLGIKLNQLIIKIFKMVNSEFLKNLNKEQKKAVKHLDGPLLIVAGAGSGKTKVLTSRIANHNKRKKSVSKSNT